MAKKKTPPVRGKNKQVRVSDEVYEKIKSLAVCFETADGTLRRILGLPPKK